MLLFLFIKFSGSRNALLESIRSGKQLKKVKPPEIMSHLSSPAGGGASAPASPRSGNASPLKLTAQMLNLGE